MAGVYGSNLGFNVDQYGIRLGADRAGQANNYLQSPTGSGPSQFIPPNQNPNLSPGPFVPAASSQNIPANAWNQPVGGGGFTNGAGQPLPGGAPSAPTSQGGGDGSMLLNQLIQQTQGYDPSAKINQAFDLQTKQGLQDMGMSWEDQMAARGISPDANTGQDLKSRLTAQLLGPLGAQRAAALAGAEGDKFNRLQSLTGLQMDQQRLAQEQAYRQQNDTYQRSRDAQEQAWRQQQFDYQRQQNDRAQTWQSTQQQWATEDRAKQQQATQLAAQQGQPGSGGAGSGQPAQTGWRDPLTGSSTPYTGGGLSYDEVMARAGGGAGTGGTSFAPSINASASGGLGSSGGAKDWHLNPGGPSGGTGISSGGAGAQPGGIGGAGAGARPPAQTSGGLWSQTKAQTPGAAPPGQGSTLYQPAGGSYKPPGGR